PAPPAAGADLDLNIVYYSKVVTPEGVTREARYEEKMLRRAGHVWNARVLPASAQEQHEHEANPLKKVAARKSAEHKHFNHVVLPRHVVLENNKPRVEFIDAHDKEIISIPAAEFDNVSFDGSWEHAYFLLDSKRLKAMPLSARASSVPGARWREREEKGLFERVLWDENRQIPLVIESGDKAATFYNRVEMTVQAGLTRELPWQKLKGYGQKEYSDFLD
ncbi:hypothetical protein HSX11_29480, partial [Oxalobacteraceae bacterium]|nr:hypothetical protein [Oxalobacteraceae bacterium]